MRCSGRTPSRRRPFRQMRGSVFQFPDGGLSRSCHKDFSNLEKLTGFGNRGGGEIWELMRHTSRSSWESAVSPRHLHRCDVRCWLPHQKSASRSSRLSFPSTKSPSDPAHQIRRSRLFAIREKPAFSVCLSPKLKSRHGISRDRKTSEHFRVNFL